MFRLSILLSGILIAFSAIGKNPQDLILPQLVLLNPENNGIAVSSSVNLQLTFDESVQLGSGQVLIYNETNLFQTININSANVQVNGAIVTIIHNPFPSGATIYIEIDQAAISDLTGNPWGGFLTPNDWTFTVDCFEIACFTSIPPTSPTTNFIIPNSHTFQLLAQSGDPYTNSGSFPLNFDFTCYVAENGSSEQGKISLNHENSPVAGVTIMDVNFNSTSQLWTVSNSGPIDFTPVVRTQRNCSGGITPWGTVLIGEEVRTAGDTNSDGHQDVGWLVEIDVNSRQVMDYGNGPEKLWKLGRMAHENAAVSFSDNRTVYFGEDDSLGCLYKFIANTPGNLSQGVLYVLKLDSALESGNPLGSGGVWMQVPNDSLWEQNTTYFLATNMEASPFRGIEDVEFGPDGKLYFASKGHGRIYRFIDNGLTVSGFETFVGGRNYNITSNGNVFSEPWGIGNDNLAFDGEGNLWVLQDGSKNYIWVVRNEHTQLNPRVELFGSTPLGGEPTGITFSPDKRFLFMSIQHPNNSNLAQTDATGNSISINKSSMLVIARKENLGLSGNPLHVTSIQPVELNVYPVPVRDMIHVTLHSNLQDDGLIELVDCQGKIVYSKRVLIHAGNQELSIPFQQMNGFYVIRASGSKFQITRKITAEL
jgi:hypothetical protein